MAEKKNPKEESDNESQSSGREDNDEFEPESGNEEMEDYKVDGYHPVTVGEVFNGKYQIVQKLGWGYFSTVWLVNEKKTTNYYALKIQKSKKSYSEAAVDEQEILKALSQNVQNPEWRATQEELNKKYNFALLPHDTFTIRLYDNFCHFGMHGKHYCSTFEIMGPNLLDLIQFFEYQDKGMDIRLVKLITRQVLIGLDYMHRICKVIHTDLKPENIMLELRGSQLEEFINDLKEYKKKPLSMKFLKKLQATNAKSKKKQQKKKLKKQLKKQAQQGSTEGTAVSEGSAAISYNSTPIQSQTMEENSASISATSPNQEILEVSNKSQSVKEEQKTTQLNGEPNKEAAAANGEHKNVEEAKTAIEEEKPKTSEKEGEQTEMQEETKTNPDDWSYTLKWKDHINVKLDKDIRMKIVDFGNGCWVHKHFTDNIQTREYRSPEAILGSPYNERTDIWSLACVVFEMLTSNYLFKPKKSEKYSKNDDHLALMIEHLGKMPKGFALKGKYSRDFFNKDGKLLKIKEKDLRETSVADALTEDDQIDEEEAKKIEKFLLPMLEYDPEKRISAKDALESEWLWT